MSTPSATARATASAALRPVVLAAVLTTGVLLAAGCGGAGDEPPLPESSTLPTDAPPPGSPSNRPVPATPDPLVARPPAGATALPADRVDTSALPPGLPTLVWTRDDRTIGAYGRGGGCTDARLEVVEQGPEGVVLRVVQFTTGPGPCTRELIYPPLEATLDAPLGNRGVVLTGEVP
ncbi:hypothetical protein [Actinomycetospora cinnamomea]|uniref:LppP/LprE lipoprotein n=1 Tax=Actinomycetospora cinnamomea TaxID=663609 RepID=A0A2U1FQ71_9PSEU|nr:hypothetical protein [Actinomycetospora cinnamomea]PVZ14296.1 hypothetical protein C8D89_101160 [Actinomycetospora cinnamomea]